MTTTADVQIFATHNSTNRHAVLIDGRFGLFDDLAEAERVYDLIGGDDGSDGLAETPFGSCQLVPAGYQCKGCYHDSHTDIADHVDQASDVEGYIFAAWLKSANYAPDPGRPTYDMDDTSWLFNN